MKSINNEEYLESLKKIETSIKKIDNLINQKNQDYENNKLLLNKFAVEFELSSELVIKAKSDLRKLDDEFNQELHYTKNKLINQRESILESKEKVY